MSNSERANSRWHVFPFVCCLIALCVLLAGFRLFTRFKPILSDPVDFLSYALHPRRQAQTRLSYYCYVGRADKVAAILKSYPDLVNAYRNGETPLHEAILFGRSSVVAVLIRYGANVNARERSTGFTPLMHAAMGQNADVVRQLIAAGAQVNLFDNDNRTALHYAVTDDTHGDLDMVKLLVKLGADINACRAGGETPLSAAEHSGFPPWDVKGTPVARAVVAYLKQHGARIKCRP